MQGAEKIWGENCCRMMKGYDPHEPTTIGKPGLLYVIMPALRIKDWDHVYLETDFEEIGG
ncbi:MAG: hypothetical protein ANIMEMIM_00030 [Candidatus Argoarchaeum ethanivorans]|uniref:Uncharacterized protein n=1 Tax=Candidatus Argoarchaeum ethanivorans TaxID=2608793 RepID=A0A811T720_9EURY|nr:MAG: hypothetical protein KFBDDELM_00024 [Candidatus Argoarchaeum ethanivorans]CAD6490868.1 MAG: hypothetical protein ANIMEMIM_00030 [Candidatus Argoarchaeum ethanivorans]CAD6491653.1 MAG: hypothetical protein FFODKBPE_00194 [Candidatus Argoarchaeum ethanivorans]CAD6493509.1 MAG: hypothetical protein EMLJLAPB_00542 [Candidatus Argoarchaeum ethanivorans]